MTARFVRDQRVFPFLARKIEIVEQHLVQFKAGALGGMPALRFDSRSIQENSSIAHSTWCLLLLAEVAAAEEQFQSTFGAEPESGNRHLVRIRFHANHIQNMLENCRQS